MVVSDADVQKMLDKIDINKSKKENDFSVGESVRVLEAPFEGFTAVIEKIDLPKETATVSIPILGRQISVDLSFKSIKSIKE
jgi:transcriptional antiterminator NusG